MKNNRLAITLVPPFAAAVVFLLRKYILKLSFLLPPCTFYSRTGLLCPGCGNTRAVRELMELHFFSAVKYNVTIPAALVFFALLYVQYVISAWVKPIRIIPRNYTFYIIIGILFVLYCVLRNFI